jgi:LacI family transcriptional regulator
MLPVVKRSTARRSRREPPQAGGPANLKMVAARAKTSPSTVSRVLNGLGQACRISQATQERIFAAAHELGFQPNSVAKSLRLGSTGLIGLLLPDVSNPFFAAIARAVSVAAQHRGRSILLADTRDDAAVETTALAAMLTGHVDGLIVIPVGQEGDHLRRIAAGRIPLVLVDRGLPGPALPCVASDHRQGARLAIDHLVALGHRRIGCITGLAGTLPNKERLAGAREALAAHGLELEPRLVAGEGFGMEDGRAAIRKLLASGAEFTALLAFSNLSGIGALEGLLAAGRRVPEEVSLISFDELPSSAVLAVPMTTVRQDDAEIGRLAVEMVCNLSERPGDEPPASIVVPTSLVPRASVAPPGRAAEPAAAIRSAC